MIATDDAPGLDRLGPSEVIWIDESSGQIVEAAAGSDHLRTPALSRPRELAVYAEPTQARTPGRQLQFSFVSRGTKRMSLPTCASHRLPARGGAP